MVKTLTQSVPDVELVPEGEDKRRSATIREASNGYIVEIDCSNPYMHSTLVFPNLKKALASLIGFFRSESETR